jgi:hypothetical protein
MTYESLIEDFEMVQGDSSPIWFMGLPDGRYLNDGNWSGRYVIALKHGDTPIIDRPLPFNSGTGEQDSYEAGTKFVFQILPSESELLTGKKYIVAVEISNDSINYRGEIARFELKVLTGN